MKRRRMKRRRNPLRAFLSMTTTTTDGRLAQTRWDNDSRKWVRGET